MRGSWGKGAGRAIGGGGDRHTWLSTSGGRLVRAATTPSSVDSFSSLLAAPLAPALLKPLPHPTSLRFVDSLAGGIAAASHGGTTLVCGAGPE